MRRTRNLSALTSALATAALAVTSASSAALAESAPSYAIGSPESIHGTIAAITGKYTLTLSDERGFVDSVTLHDGTAIEPSGVSLAVGQVVTIFGKTDGGTFDADDIDTDGGSDYDSAETGGGGFAGPLAYGDYPSYVVPVGAGLYYYGNGATGVYYNSGYGYFTGGVKPGPGPKNGVGSGHAVPLPHEPIGRVHPPLLPAPPANPGAPAGGAHASGSSAHGPASGGSGGGHR